MIQDLFRLDGKVALITGASKGIGAAIAEAFAEAGARVILSSRKLESLEVLQQALADKGHDVHVIPANVGKEADIHLLAEQSLAWAGGVDILVNNAAANPVFGPLEQTASWAFDKIMEVNLKGPFELSKLLLPSMKTKGKGAIIHISSIGGLRPEPQLGMYSVSKAALLSLAKVMAKEWGAYGIRVNAICPGLIQTKFSEALWSNEKIMRHMMAAQPIPRVGSPQEIAALALYLASDASAFSTGAVFTADGGYTI